ncbi:MAG: RNA 3'-terminal phosphate cyclase, partial [Myxococcales bacterium]|nr:RNA 3'-terminal phosphate cyclase [Myxococcales bacterium]
MQIASPRDDEQELVALDGRVGGGHVLRSALCLAAVTGRGFALERFRQDCKMPGLLRSHLAVVRAMAEVCQAEVTGAALNCTSLQFKPGRLVAGEYAFAVGAAGSAIVLLQTVATALLHADGVSTVTVRGGTHVSSAPPFAFVQQSWLPALRKMGAKIDVTLEQWGFFPAGGGQVRATVHPSPLQPIALDKRGALLGIKVVAASSLLNAKVARRELRTLTTGLKELQVQGIELPVVTQEAMAVRDSPGPGNICWLE